MCIVFKFALKAGKVYDIIHHFGGIELQNIRLNSKFGIYYDNANRSIWNKTIDFVTT